MYIICFDFYKDRMEFDPADEDKIGVYGANQEYAESYMERCFYLKNEMHRIFGNRLIQISAGCFVLKSDLTEPEVLDRLRIKYTVIGKEQQYYVARISSLSENSFKEKELELEYIKSL